MVVKYVHSFWVLVGGISFSVKQSSTFLYCWYSISRLLSGYCQLSDIGDIDGSRIWEAINDYDASVSQFNWWLVNQQRPINDCVFRLFDSSKYLITLSSTNFPYQKAKTLILITSYNLSCYLWKPSKKSFGTAVFLSLMSFKICDYDKPLSNTPVPKFWL